MARLTFKDGTWYTDTGRTTQPPARPGRGAAWVMHDHQQFISRFDALVRDLQAFTHSDATVGSELQNWLPSMIERLTDPQVTITFGGHFSSGKSMLIDALLGRQLLPVNDYPETGSICVLRRGLVDAAEVVGASKRWRIPCTTEAIGSEVSLVLPTGAANTAVREVHRVEITLASAHLPANGIWIDSPGTDDSPDLMEHAYRAAEMADVLVWVLSGRQILAIDEQEFLETYIARHGAASVIFVINAFLSQDTQAEWDAYQARHLPTAMSKIGDRALAIGFTEQTPPDVIAVAARAFGRHGSEGFGGKDACALMSALDMGTRPRVRRARLARLATGLRNMAAEVDRALAAELPRIESEKRALAAAQEEASRQSAGFRSTVERKVDLFLAAWANRVEAGVPEVINGISSTSFKRDQTYAQLLNAQFCSAASAAGSDLIAAIRSAAVLYGQRPLLQSVADELQGRLTPAEVTITVPDNMMRGRAIVAGAAAGAAVAVPLPIIGPIAGGIIGGFLGAMKSGSDAYEKDVVETKDNVRRAKDQAVAAMRGRRAEIISQILRHCGRDDRALLAPVDETRLRRLHEAKGALERLLSEADALLADDASLHRHL